MHSNEESPLASRWLGSSMPSPNGKNSDKGTQSVTLSKYNKTINTVLLAILDCTANVDITFPFIWKQNDHWLCGLKSAACLDNKIMYCGLLIEHNAYLIE